MNVSQEQITVDGHTQSTRCLQNRRARVSVAPDMNELCERSLSVRVCECVFFKSLSLRSQDEGCYRRRVYAYKGSSRPELAPRERLPPLPSSNNAPEIEFLHAPITYSI